MNKHKRRSTSHEDKESNMRLDQPFIKEDDTTVKAMAITQKRWRHLID